MGIFGGKKANEDTQLDMIVATTENIGKPYDVLGLVTASTVKLGSSNPENVAKELIKKAKEMGADAIVGFRFQYNAIEIAYGTAVKYK
ncbi:heavy metal-binding domain-containing protein [Brevibacillus reuszeri]|uniref:heavy metal-binding domain-containing protein n=1 Tax=Brevibacillus reuszeri TaxID=54915 RepID=UPI00367033A5